MTIKLYEDKVRIKNTNIIGTLIDKQFRKDKKKKLYILEEENRDENGKFQLHDVWEDEIEILNKRYKND